MASHLQWPTFQPNPHSACFGSHIPDAYINFLVTSKRAPFCAQWCKSLLHIPLHKNICKIDTEFELT